MYYAPDTLEEVLSTLHDFGREAMVLAGGQDIVPLMNQGRLTPRRLIDLKALRDLAGVKTKNGSIQIGALTTHRTIERADLIRTGVGLLADAACQIGGGAQVRNRGTVGGAVCAGNPAYDYAPCLVALDAQFRLQSKAGDRQIAAAQFFQDAHITAIRPEEVLSEIAVPVLNSMAGFSYQKLKFTDGCYSIASAACAMQLNEDATFGLARLALGGVANVPIRLHQVEALLKNAHLNNETLSEVQNLAQQAVTDPITDVMADGTYRRAMAGVMAKRALVAAYEHARERQGVGRERS